MSENETLEAMSKFFGKYTLYDFEQQEQVMALFSEWLIFEYRNNKNQRLIDLYYLKDPDSLPENQSKELKQIIETERYDFLEIDEIKKGEHFTAYGIYSGKEYKIYDKMGSSSLPEIGTLPGRIAKINKKWHLVGTDTFVIPMTYTNRAKKMLKLKDSQEKISCKQILEYYLPKDIEKTKFSAKEIKNKRKKLISK